MINKTTVASINANLIAPCGMNCSLCSGFLRSKNKCPGCSGNDSNKPQHCIVCKIKHCDELKSDGQKFCFSCSKFPCRRLQNLDRRYKTKYRMSMLENLENIRKNGLASFIDHEKERWNCPQCGGIICVHKSSCIYCNHAVK